MAFPFTEPHPVIGSSQILRVSAALEAAGAWDVAPLEIAPAGFKSMALAFSYTRGGAAGAFDFQIQYSIYAIAGAAPAGAAEWVNESIYTGGVVVAGVDTQSFLQREFQTYTATGAGQEAFLFGAVDFAYSIERIRVDARESGNVGAPGTLQIQVTLGR